MKNWSIPETQKPHFTSAYMHIFSRTGRFLCKIDTNIWNLHKFARRGSLVEQIPNHKHIYTLFSMDDRWKLPKRDVTVYREGLLYKCQTLKIRNWGNGQNVVKLIHILWIWVSGTLLIQTSVDFTFCEFWWIWVSGMLLSLHQLQWHKGAIRINSTIHARLLVPLSKREHSNMESLTRQVASRTFLSAHDFSTSHIDSFLLTNYVIHIRRYP